jgi:hypothetical protein
MKILSGGRISTKLSFMVLLIDDFTGKPITSAEAVDIYIEGAPMTAVQVIKKDGYRSFSGFEGDDISLDIVSNHYARRHVNISRKNLDPRNPVVHVRMFPSENYALPKGTTSIKFYAADGAGAPASGFKIRMVLCGGFQYKLLEETDKGAKAVKLLCPGQSMLEGKGLVFLDGPVEIDSMSYKAVDFVTLAGLSKENDVILKSPLEHAYDTDALLSVYYDCEADAKGLFYMPLNRFEGQCSAVYLIYETGGAEEPAMVSGFSDYAAGSGFDEYAAEGGFSDSAAGGKVAKVAAEGKVDAGGEAGDRIKQVIIKRDITPGMKNILADIKV